MKQAANPESGTTNYTYDPNSNLFTRQDARLITTTYGYDALNRAQTRTYTNDPQTTPQVTYSYDAPLVPYSKGRLTQVTSNVSTGDYLEYDQLGRLKQSRQTTAGGAAQGYTTGYAYNLAGAMTGETYPSGRVITTGFDTAGRITQISGQKTGEMNKTYASQFSYASHGAVGAMQLGNGKWEHTSFNNTLQPTQIGLGISGTDSSVLKLDYTYGTTTNNGNVISQTITAPGLTLNQCYGYDSLNRLSTAEERSGGTTCSGTQQWKQAFTYDRFGNRNFDVVNTTANVLGPNPTISQSTNRIASGQNYGYENAGNLTSDPTTPVNGIVYDAENRQTQYTKSAQATNYYYYDGDGHRVKKIDSSGTTVFVYNVGGQLIAEYTSGTPSGGGTSYLTSDHLGSTRVVMKPDGSVARHDYLPFGEEIQAGIGGRTAGQGYVADNVRQKFTQKERDNESGLDYFGARYYSSAQGRFTSVDPLMASGNTMSPQSWNRYSYVFNNPLVFVDPTGQFADFYDQNGNRLGTDGNDDGRVYVVTAKKDVDAIKKADKNGATTQVSWVNSAIELPSFAARQEIGGAAVDRSNRPSTAAGDTQGGFHEEGGYVGTDVNGQELIVPAVPGPVSDPRTDTGAHIDVFKAADPSQTANLAGVTTTYHVHPSGELDVTPKPPPGTVVFGNEKLRNFVQSPSEQDKSVARQRDSQLGIRTNVVVGARDHKVYVYNGSGVRATFPLDRFRTVR